MTTKAKNQVTYNPTGPINSWQKKRIMRNCQYKVDIKDEWVQWVTGGASSSLRSITQAQATQIIRTQEGSMPVNNATNKNWGNFNINNTQHLRILSTLRNAGITTTLNDGREVADMLGWFNRFLKSTKSPVKKPLLKMHHKEVSKIITALEGVAVWKHSI